MVASLLPGESVESAALVLHRRPTAAALPVIPSRPAASCPLAACLQASARLRQLLNVNP